MCEELGLSSTAGARPEAELWGAAGSEGAANPSPEPLPAALAQLRRPGEGVGASQGGLGVGWGHVGSL